MAITVLASFLLMSLISLEAKAEGEAKRNTKMVQYTGMQIGPYGMRAPHRTVKSKVSKKVEKTKDQERTSLRGSSIIGCLFRILYFLQQTSKETLNF